MANELVYTTLSQVTVQSSGASNASNGVIAAGTLTTANHSNYTGVDLVLTASMSASIASASNFFGIYARPLDIDGTADAPIPSSATNAFFKGGYVGAIQFAGASVASQQTGVLLDVPTVPYSVEFYVENLTNASMSAGWTLKATPKTVKPL